MALWLGLSNRDLSRSLIVLSGGGALPDERTGRPRLYIAHGTLDRIIPVTLGGDMIVRELRGQGYNVRYRRSEVATALSPRLLARPSSRN